MRKILFQIPNRHTNKFGYIEKYIKHPLLKNKIFLNKFSEFKNVDKNFNSLLKSIKSDPHFKDAQKWLNKNPRFIQLIQTLIEQFRNEFINYTIESLCSFLLCNHDLQTHSQEIKYYTKLLASAVLLNDDTTPSTLALFEKIFSKDINEFAFPASINTTEEKIIFLETITLKQRIQAITEAIKIKKEYKTVFF